MKKALALILVLSMLAVICLPLNAAAATVTASIRVSEDTYSEESDPDTAVGKQNASLITTSNTGGSKPAAANRNVYLKYDLRSYDLSTLTSAKIKLHINTVSNKADRTISVYSVASDWSEDTLTWSNAPTPSEAAITTYLQKYVKNANKDIWITIDVTDFVKEHYTDEVISFMLSSDTGSDKTYVSYIDNRGNIKLTQYDNVTDTYEQVFVREGFVADDHSNPALFILPDHRIMVIYSQHTEEECFYYRISVNSDDATEFGEEKIISTQGFGTVTYPTPFYMSSTPDSFYLLQILC